MFKDMLLANRSYRNFDESREITREEMLELVDLTRYTASSANRQALKYYITTEKEMVEKILPLTGWAKLLPMELPKEGRHPGAFVVICQDKTISGNLNQYKYDAGITAEAMLLGATEKGLGGCMIGSYRDAELRQLLNLDESLEIQLVVAFGKPDEEIHIVDAENGDVKYYRDETGEIHYVPKRRLEDMIIL